MDSVVGILLGEAFGIVNAYDDSALYMYELTINLFSGIVEIMKMHGYRRLASKELIFTFNWLILGSQKGTST